MIIQKHGSQRRLSQRTLYESGRNSRFSSRGVMALQSTAMAPPDFSRSRLLLLHERLHLDMSFRNSFSKFMHELC